MKEDKKEVEGEQKDSFEDRTPNGWSLSAQREHIVGLTVRSRSLCALITQGDGSSPFDHNVLLHKGSFLKSVLCFRIHERARKPNLNKCVFRHALSRWGTLWMGLRCCLSRLGYVAAGLWAFLPRRLTAFVHAALFVVADVFGFVVWPVVSAF